MKVGRGGMEYGWSALNRRLLAVLLIGELFLAGARGANAAIAVVGTGTGGSTNATSLALAKPAGTMAGHLLLAQINASESCLLVLLGACIGIGIGSNDITPPAGWNLLRENFGGWPPLLGIGSTRVRQAIFWRIADGSEPASLAWTFSRSGPVAGGILALSGVNNANPFDGHSGQGGYGTTITAPSITTTTPNALLLAFFGAERGNPNIGLPAAMSSAYVFGTGAGPSGMRNGAAYEPRTLAGSTGSRQASFTGGDASNVGQLVALREGAASLLDHIRIEHDGQGLTCQSEPITIKACADDSCSSLYTGSVTVDLTSPASVWSPDPVTFSGGSTTVNLNVATASTVTLAATATSPLAAKGTRCFNGATETCAVSFSACAGEFTCLEAREPVSGTDLREGRLYTKLAGTAFGFDVAALKSDGARETNYVVSGGSPRTVTVELVDASSGGDCSALPALVPSVSQAVTFTSTDAGRKAIAPVTVNRAWRHVKCRVTDATVNPSKVACSSDGFAIRPTAFSSVSTTQATADTANGASTTATPRLQAGSTPFDLTATAIAGYDGTPKIDNALIEAHVDATAAGTVAGDFDAAASSTGIASGSGFTYSEVGYFRFKINGVYDDGFTSIDSGGGDCINDFSNTVDPTIGKYKYGCKFGNDANTGWFGRFVPDRFTLISSSLTPACGSGFSYMDQPFALAYKLEARNAGGTKTANYHGGFAKATVTRVAENNDDGVDRAPRLLSSITEPGWSNGLLVFNDDAEFKFIFMRAATPDGPFNALTLGVSLKDNDGEMATLESMDMNATTSGNCASSGNCSAKVLGGSPTTVRYGRMTAGRVHQFMENQSLTLPLTAEYYDGATFSKNSLDSCTTLGDASKLRLDNNQQVNQLDGTIDIGAGSTSVSGFGTFSSGELNLSFSAPGSGNSGFADLTPQLGTMPWLRYDWDGDGAHDDDPKGRASWGMYRGNKNVIYLRERWN